MYVYVYHVCNIQRGGKGNLFKDGLESQSPNQLVLSDLQYLQIWLEAKEDVMCSFHVIFLKNQLY